MPKKTNSDVVSEKFAKKAEEAIGLRIAAFIIDLIILGVVSMFIFAANFLGGGGIFGMLMSFVAVILLWILYGFILEGFIGQTIGKMAVGVVVVKKDGSRCGFLASFIRNLLRIIDWWPTLYIIGIILIALTHYHQRIGDLAAGTIVIKK